jgi:hypothetical protein
MDSLAAADALFYGEAEIDTARLRWGSGAAEWLCSQPEIFQGFAD